MNIDTQMFELLYAVAYKTALEMSVELLEMSCFVSNWSEQSTEAVAEPLAA